MQRNARKIVIHSSKEEWDTGESKDPMCVYIPCFVMPFFRRFTTSSEISITPAEDGFGLSIETERGSDECAAPMFLTRFFIAAIVCSTNRKVQNLIEIVTIYLHQSIRNKPGAQQSLSSTKNITLNPKRVYVRITVLLILTVCQLDLSQGVSCKHTFAEEYSGK